MGWLYKETVPDKLKKLRDLLKKARDEAVTARFQAQLEGREVPGLREMQLEFTGLVMDIETEIRGIGGWMPKKNPAR